MSDLSKNTLLWLITLLLAPMLTLGQSGPYKRVRIEQSSQTQQQLIQLGIFPDHFHSEGAAWVMEWSQEEYALAVAAAVPMDILSEDVEQWYATRTAENPSPESSSGLPAGFHLGSMGGYLTYDEVVLELDQLSTQYPGIVSIRDSIGKTHEGRAIWMVKISDHPELDEDEPEVLYNALHHAREPISMMQLIYFMHFLAEGYGQDSLVTDLIRSRELFFIPVVNPDGYVYNQTQYPNGGGMWRKNRKPNPGGGMGVDLNRNYGFQWGADNLGSSPSPTSNTYRGASAFSELETQAIRDLCIAHDFKASFNSHGYGEWMIYPWGYSESVPLPDLVRFGEMVTSLVSNNHYYPGSSQETVGYLSNGVMEDWMYGEQQLKPKAFSFSPECGNSTDGFWPVPGRIADLCAAQVSANLRLASLAGGCLDLHDITPTWLGGSNLSVPVKVRNPGMGNISQYQVEFTSSSPAMTVLGGPVQVPNGLASVSDVIHAFNVHISPLTPAGTWIEGMFRIRQPGGVEKSLPVRFQYDAPTILVTEDAEHGANAWAGTWGVTTELAYAGIHAFTDSPNQFYADNSFTPATIAVDLSNYHGSLLHFHARWDVDHAHDHVQVLASTDGLDFDPLAGNWSWDGIGPAQPANSPLYEGRKYDWVEEKIELSAFDGGMLYLRFALQSDAWGTRDGFYFDDLEITAYKDAVGQGPRMNGPDASLIPNPSTGKVKLTGIGGYEMGLRLEIRDLRGVLVHEGPAQEGLLLDLGSKPSGIYFYRVVGPDTRSAWNKLVRH